MDYNQLLEIFSHVFFFFYCFYGKLRENRISDNTMLPSIRHFWELNKKNDDSFYLFFSFTKFNDKYCFSVHL